jgi:hypothetical protein
VARVPVYKFVDLCLAQRGDKYVFGAEASPTDPNPEAFDCSELVEWALERLGVPFADGSMNQRAATTRISVANAIAKRGALLFRDVSVNGIGHVAVSLGNDYTIEARGTDYGVGKFSATVGRTWTEGGLIPGLDYSKLTRPPETINRWVVFGKHGARFAGNRDLKRLVDDIREAEKKTGAAVVIQRKEPKKLEIAKSYPRWRAEKIGR